MSDNLTDNISEDEAALYDRQIRLWGLDAQKRLRSAKILVAGLSGLGAEICKNIVLAGIKSLTILDDAKVSQEDGCSQFFVTDNDIGKNRGVSSLANIQQLNPMVEVIAISDKIEDKTDDFFLNFDVVCLIACPSNVSIRINRLCHKNKIKFYSGDVSGYFGYMFADLEDHEYAEEVVCATTDKIENENGSHLAKKIKLEKNTKTVKKTISYVPLENALRVDWTTTANKARVKRVANSYFIMKILDEFGNKHGRKPSLASKNKDVEDLMKILDGADQHVLESIDTIFTQNCFSELSPICAIVGGIISQEIIKAVSMMDRPHNNFFFYNGLTGNGVVESIMG